MIAEPIQGVGGFATPPDGFFKAFKDVLDEYGILFVSDEVQTGWGRTGEHMWGYQSHGITPDILTFAKGIGNGLSIGGVVARAEIMDCIGKNGDAIGPDTAKYLKDGKTQVEEKCDPDVPDSILVVVVWVSMHKSLVSVPGEMSHISG